MADEAISSTAHDGSRKPTSVFSKRRLGLRLGSEFGPLIIFFIVAMAMDIYWATGAFMGATAAVVGLSWWRTGRLPVVPMVSLGFVLLLGGLTLGTRDELFILIRPTVVNGLFGLGLVASVAVGRPGLKLALGGALPMTDAGWRGLSLRVGGFLLALALLNELVWRGLGVEAWVWYKTFGVLPLNALFLFSQWPYAQRHRPD